MRRPSIMSPTFRLVSDWLRKNGDRHRRNIFASNHRSPPKDTLFIISHASNKAA